MRTSGSSLAEKILTLLEQHHLLSAPQMLELLAAQQDRYNKTSIYRALDTLLAKNQLCKHTFQGQEARYELREHHHAHAVCTQCGRIQTTECRAPKQSQVPHFTVDHHHLTLFGTCKDCEQRA